MNKKTKESSVSSKREKRLKGTGFNKSWKRKRGALKKSRKE